MTVRLRSLGFGLLLLAVAAGRARAEEPSRWRFELLLYGWIPGNFGTLNVKGRTAPIDTTVYEALKLVEAGDALGGAAYFSAEYDRFGGFVDVFGLGVEEKTQEKVPTRFCTLCVSAKAELRQVISDFALTYRLGQWSLPKRQLPITLGVYAGARYMHTGTDLKGTVGVVGGAIRNPNVSKNFNWADPMIGVRWQVPILDPLALDFRADIGGFGVSSELIWGIVAGVRYSLSWQPWGAHSWLTAGYRRVDFDRDFGAGNSLELAFSGPIAGLGFTF